MAFNSWLFLVFLPLVLGGYYMLPFKHRWLLLLIASYLFYMCYAVNYGLILLLSTTICWTVARAIHQSNHAAIRKRLLVLGIVADAGILFLFKYLGFFESLISSVSNGSSIFDADVTNFLLPIGISFYTFKSLGYLIDVYRKVAKPEPHFGYFALFVSFFPQLVAGPIERANVLLPQLHNPQRVDYNNLQIAITRIAWGFFKKLVVADTVGEFVQFTFSDVSSANGLQLYITLLFFAVQLYADFSGYCDIAIGTAGLFGIRLSENFNKPYLSTSIAMYWSRWHITLTDWIRDYIFIPLNRGVTAYWRIYLNTLIIFLLIGLWHGASIDFVLFGLINGVLAVLQAIYKRLTFVPKFKSKAGKIFLIIWNFHLLLLSGVVFRARNFEDARLFYFKLFSGFNSSIAQLLNGFSGFDFMLCCLVSSIFVMSVFLPQNYRFKYPYLFLFITITLIVLLGKNAATHFIYFQF